MRQFGVSVHACPTDSPGLAGLGRSLKEMGPSITGFQDDQREEKAYGQGLNVGEQHIECLKTVFYVSMVWPSPRLDDRLQVATRSLAIAVQAGRS